MYFWRPSMPYDLIVNQIFRALKRRLNAIPQCFMVYSKSYLGFYANISVFGLLGSQ